MGVPHTVLIADDDPAIRELYADLLSDEGYKVQTAPNGRAALECVYADGIDLVLMDIMMPELDGISACQRLKSNPRSAHIPVVLISAQGNLTRENQELACADALVPKPFELKTMLGTVHNLLN